MRLLFALSLYLVMAFSGLAAERTATFAIGNMTCSTCPLMIKVAVQRVDGVKDVQVDYERKTATVVFDDARTTTVLIATAISDAGFPATLMVAKP